MSLEWRGLYDGVSILLDSETGTLWHHITGEGLYGPLAGKRLGLPSNLVHTTAGNALREYPDLEIAVSDRPIVRENRWAPLAARIPVLGRRLRATMAREDDRRPTMDMGLGVWVADSTAQYYALEAVAAVGGAVVDTLAGTGLLVYFDPRARAMGAMYTEASSATWEDDRLVLSNGRVLERGALLDTSGTRVPVERPLQQFTRWYGWVLTFPETDIWARDN